MTAHYDDKETRDPARREANLMQALGPFLARVAGKAPGWAEQLDGHDLRAISDRAGLATLPVLRKPDLMAMQAADPPFGGLALLDSLSGSRIFVSPGPVYEPQGKGPDPWHAARALFAAGFRSGDIVHNALSYHLTPGGFILDEGLRALGCHVIPAGVGNTEQQIETALAVRPSGFAGTPDFLKVMLDKAREMGRTLDCFRTALVSGGALFPALREEYASRGIAVAEAYATADAGVIAYESPGNEGLIVNEDVALEIVRPGTDDPVPDGEVGEIVVTVFSETYPLIRFGTGDMSTILPGPSPCGRTNVRIKGWMGRADQRTKVKGMFVDPKQVDAIVKHHKEIKKARLVVTRQNDQDAMTLQVEAVQAPDLAAKVVDTLKAETKLSGTVEIVAPGDLPNDGKIIADERDYSA